MKHHLEQVEEGLRPSPTAEPAALPQDSLAELARWERFTLKRWGQTNPRPFEVRALPDDLAFEVTAELLAADTPDAARAIFQAARERLAG